MVSFSFQACPCWYCPRAALITVLSVMNGFQERGVDRMLGVVSHIEIYVPRRRFA
jgi:ABC-type lipoprotein release transport system permease subunit